MALSTYARTQLAFGMADRAAAKEVADLIDTAAAGTLGARAKATLRACFASLPHAKLFITAVEASAAGSNLATLKNALGRAIGSRKAAAEILDAIGVS